MSTYQRVEIIGFLGNAPEVRYTTSGQAVARFSVATSNRWKDKDGKTQEQTEWHKVVLYRRLAELAKQYLEKGSYVFLTGRLETRSWEDKDGGKHSVTEIIGTELKFLDRNPSKSVADSDPVLVTDDLPPPSDDVPFN